MTTWIKFTERQPEKAGSYLCWDDGDPYILDWHQGCERTPMFWDPLYDEDHSEANCTPGYWAEINPPEEIKVSGPEEMELARKIFQGASSYVDYRDVHKKEPSMSEKPLCKDCRWIGGEIHAHSYALCGCPRAPHSLVDGTGFYPCQELRKEFSPLQPGYRAQLTAAEAAAIQPLSETCGPEGRWFEAKEEEIVEVAPEREGVDYLINKLKESLATTEVCLKILETHIKQKPA